MSSSTYGSYFSSFRANTFLICSLLWYVEPSSVRRFSRSSRSIVRFLLYSMIRGDCTSN